MTKFKTLVAATLALALTGSASAGSLSKAPVNKYAITATLIAIHNQHCSEPTPPAAKAIFLVLTGEKKKMSKKDIDAARQWHSDLIKAAGLTKWCEVATESMDKMIAEMED